MKKPVLWLLIAINLFAALYGFYYYAYEFPQIFSRPVYLWPFIPDSAVAVMLGVVVLAGAVRSGLLGFIASIYLAKYGMWTAFVMLLHPNVYLVPPVALISISLFILPHIGMALESLLTLPRRISPNFLPIALGWFLFNDSLDYILGIHTRIPESNLELVALFSFCLTLLLCFGFARYGERIVKLKHVAKLREFFLGDG